MLKSRVAMAFCLQKTTDIARPSGITAVEPPAPARALSVAIGWGVGGSELSFLPDARLWYDGVSGP